LHDNRVEGVDKEVEGLVDGGEDELRRHDPADELGEGSGNQAVIGEIECVVGGEGEHHHQLAAEHPEQDERELEVAGSQAVDQIRGGEGVQEPIRKLEE
jgi:hypothetical protein